MKRTGNLRALTLVFSAGLLAMLLASCEKKSSDDEALLLALALTPVGYEPGEEFSGGETTTFDSTVNAFDFPAANLRAEKRTSLFLPGNALFNTDWTTPGASARDGLGPYFNMKSCRGCHQRDGRGRPPLDSISPLSSMLIRVSAPGQDGQGRANALAVYGRQISNKDINNNELPEADPRVSYNEINGTFPDGETYTLLEPVYTMNWNYGTPGTYEYSPRTAPQVYGLGLLAAISESDILSRADASDSDGDGISGRPNMVWDEASNQTVMGRFGWKANEPNLEQQNQGAFIGDIGITSPLFTSQDCTAGNDDNGASSIDCSAPFNSHNNAPGPEIDQTVVDVVTAYTKLISVPGRRGYTDPAVLQGKALFFEIGCESCHRQTYTTGQLTGFEEVSGQKIYPYTDLLLHDMGDGLADNRADFSASGREWRTPPLWGTGLIERVNGHNRLLHDGRARGFQEAILWHGGEAEAVKNRYMNLDRSQRQALLRFLESL